MTARRNALDNDMLADLGINTPPAPPAPAAPAAPAPAPAPSTASNTKRIDVDVTHDVWLATKVYAAQQGTTVADLIRQHLHTLTEGHTPS